MNVPEVLCLLLASGLVLLGEAAGSTIHTDDTNCSLDCQHGKCENGLCKCDDGWGKLMDIPFLGCGIPQCDFRLSCDAVVNPAPPPPFQIQLNPCMVPFICGEGGVCEAAFIGLNFTCKCREGYRNLFNATSAMCFRDCQVGSKCSQLNIGIVPPPPPQSVQAPPPSRGEVRVNTGSVVWYVPMLALISYLLAMTS